MAKTKQSARRPFKKFKTGQASSSHRSPSTSEIKFNPLRSPSSVVKSFRSKGIIVEKFCVVSDLVDYQVPAILEAIGWGKILTWSGKTFASSVHGLYESICAKSANSFTIRFVHDEETVTIDTISSIIGIPRSNGPKFVSEVLPLDERESVTSTLCGHPEDWSAKNFLPASSMVPALRIIHSIFTHSIYPRKGNRTEVTPYMANLLHNVITGVPMCLPSIIMHHIIRVITGSQPCAAPFGYLITQIACSFGVIPADSERPEPTTVFNKTNIVLMKLPPPLRANPVAEEDEELEAAYLEIGYQQQPQPDQPEPQPQQPQAPPRRTVDERLSSLEQVVATVRTEFHDFRQEISGKMNKTLKYLSNISKNCRRHDDTMPPSPPDSA